MDVTANACGSLIAASIIAVVKNLRSRVLSSFISESELQNWETWLVDIEGFLKDAEERQTTDQRVKVWLDRLRDLAYDIEDVLDEFSTEALKCRVTKADSNWSSLSTALSPAALAFNHKMASKMKDITERLQVISAQEQTLDLKRTAGEVFNKQKERRPTSSLVDESRIFGRNDNKEALVQMLLRHKGSGDAFSVIHILGMGGIGKTTLAQLVYNDYKVQVSFDLKGWVCVSENFDVEMLTREILKSITGKPCEDLNFNLHQEKLKELLSLKKFLLILDDVWEENYLKWDRLCEPFAAGAAGSKIVITTRKKNVASMVVNAPILDVKGLLDDECLSLLAIHALGAKNFGSHLNLKDIALEMVKRCKGLPLAAKVLGGLLRKKQSRQDWERVLRSEKWNLPETSSGTPLAVLKLSYDDLPSHLKRCFVYCAIFPKDYEFDRDELVLLWMAEGFLQFPEGEERMEDLGIHYFDDLVSRSLFQSSSENQQKYVMHDLIHDLAQSMAGEFCYNYEKKINFNGEQSNSKLKKVRHASIRSLEEYTILTKMNSLRTILCFPNRRYYFASYVSREGHAYAERFSTLVIGSKCLRVLSLTSPWIKSLPDSIGDLKHLRHLNLSCTSIDRLPDSVSSLFNLLTLLLYSCEHLKKLPDKIGNLVNLRHLDISNTSMLKEIPSGIGMLTNLQTLNKFFVNESHGTAMAILGKLNNLRGTLSIEALDNVTNMQDARSAKLEDKQGLEELFFKWNHHHRGLESLILPHQNLKRLTIDSYGGSKLPTLHNLGHLCKLKINQCSSLVSLALAGYPSLLEDLEISSCASLKDFGADFRLPTSLKAFKIKDCPSLLSLPDGLMMLDDNTNPCQSHLKKLSIIKCEQLTSSPRGKLPATLETLEILECSSLVSLALAGVPSCLKDLEIFDCASLKDFGADVRLPISLKAFKIKDCPSLLSLPELDDNTNPCQSHLKKLSIIRCEQLTSLPCGKVPATLKTLEIQGCSSLVSLALAGLPSCLEDVKISGCASLKDFGVDFRLPTSLKAFKIEDCPSILSLPDGLMMLDDNTNPCQSHLKKLSIIRCEQLKSLPRGKLPATLETLKIWGCSSLVSLTLVGLPSRLENLEIFDCASLKDFGADFKLLTSLKAFKIEDCLSVLSLSNRLMMLDNNKYPCESHLKESSIIRCKLFIFLSHGTFEIKGCSSLVSLALSGLPSCLEVVEISGCASLKDFGADFRLPTSLEAFKVKNCPSLLSLPDGLMMLDDNTNPCQSHLKKLSIVRCEQLTSLPRGKLPATLETLEIRGCSSLVSLAVVGIPSRLEDLVIVDCASLKDFGADFKLPTSLKGFEINHCPSLLSLPDGLMMLDDNTNSCQSHLKKLRIVRCEQLTSLLRGKLPATLEALEIEGNGQMKILFSGDMFCNNIPLEIYADDEIRVFPSIDNLQSLTDLTICRCSALESFQEMSLCNLALKSLRIWSCQNLSSLPNQMDTHFPSLRTLDVSNCPLLESLTQEGGGLPKNLTSLEISRCEKLRWSIAEWRLHLLSSLDTLRVNSICPAVSDLVLFPEDACHLLPTSLRTLEIGHFKHLELLGSELQRLTHLKYLTIEDCPKLRYLPTEALPSSLIRVMIWGSAVLKEHYLKNKGQYPSFICIT